MIIEFDSYTTNDGLEVYQAKLEGSPYVFEATSPEAAIGKAMLAHNDTVIKPVVEVSEICEDCMSGEQLKCLVQIKRLQHTVGAFATAKRYWAAKWPHLRPEGVQW